MKSLTFIFALIISSMLTSCVTKTTENPSKELYLLNVIFLEFHDEKVEFKINDRIAYSGPMYVPKESTIGVAFSGTFSFKRCNKLEIKSKSVNLSDKICVNKNTRHILIHSYPSPHITTSDNDNLGLD